MDEKQTTPESNIQKAHITPEPRTELTEIGEQYVVPGCERHTTPKHRQLGLWE